MKTKLLSAGIFFLSGIIFILYLIIGKKDKALKNKNKLLIKRRQIELKDLAEKKASLIGQSVNQTNFNAAIEKNIQKVDAKVAQIKEEAKSKSKEEK